MQRKQAVFLGIGVAALLALTAGASAYVTRDVMSPDKPEVAKTAQVKSTTHKEKISWNQQQQVQPQQAQVPKCNDGNIVGVALGGIAGGVAGNQLGKGKGNTAATIGGTLGGAYVGGKYIPTQNVTCR